MAGIQIPISADLDTGTIEQSLAKLTADINRLGTTVASANKVKFEPVSRTTMSDLQKVQAQFESLLRISGDLRKRLRDTGQQGADFFDIKWDQVYPDAHSRARQERKAYEYVTAGVASPFGATPGFDGRIGRDDIAGKREWDRRQRAGTGGGGNGTPASSWGSAGRQILGAGLRATGGAGSAAAGAIEGGMAGIGGPMILANLVAQGVSAVVGMVKEKIGAAQQLDIGYDVLKRQLGDVNVGFRQLKSSLENASWSFGATYEETQKVASAFAHAAGTFGKAGAEGLAGEVSVAGGFAKSFGVDPARAGAFFGAMRSSGITSDEAGSKRLALQIGDALARTGTSAKLDEVLEQVAGFVQQQARYSMTAPNTSGFLSTFASMANTGPGTDPTSVSQIISSVNSAIQHGGNAGEAGQNYLYRVLGNRNGLDPIQEMALQEGGMFGTMSGTFGKDSVMARFGKAYGVSMPTLGAGSGQTNFTSIMSGLQSKYASNPELMLSAMSRLFGINISQSAALATAQKNNPMSVEGSASRLARLHLDLSKVNATGIQRLTSIEADKTLSSGEKDRQFKAVYDKEQEKTPGKEISDGLAGVQKVITDMADKMVPLTTTIMNSVVHLAGGGVKSQRQIIEENNKAERNDAVHQINAAADAKRKAARQAKQEFNAKGTDLYNQTTDMRLSPEQRAAAQKEYDRLKSAADTSGVDAEQKAATEYQDERLAAKNKYGTPGTQSLRNAGWLIAAAAETDRLDKLTPGTTMAQFDQESHFDPSATSGRGAMGLAQVMPKELAVISKRLGRNLNPYDAHDAVLIHREMMRENMAHFGNERDALSGYNGGWDKSKWTNAETRNYAPSIMGHASDFAGTPMPDDADTKAAAAKQAAANAPAQSNGGAAGVLEHRFTFTHLDARGKPMPNIKTSFDMPNAQGRN